MAYTLTRIKRARRKEVCMCMLTMRPTLFSVLRAWTHSLPQQTRRHGAYITQVRKLSRDTENPAQAARLVGTDGENWVSEATLPKSSCSWRGSGET